MTGFESLFSFFSSALFVLVVRLFVLFLVILWLSLVYWTHRDAERRGSMGIYWAIIVFIFNIFGWLIYLIVRPPEYTMDVRERELEIKEREILLDRSDLFCASCSKPIERDFLVCPHCLKKLRNTCPKCGRAVDLDWRSCPYCKTNLPKS